MADSADKRSVATDALATLGTILGPGEKRDAIHLAVEPVVASCYLDPGDHITVRNGIAYRTKFGAGLGIVDPFLPRGVEEGEHFWFIMYPRQVRSLRHVWSHPAFPDELESTPSAVGAAPASAVPSPPFDPKILSIAYIEREAVSIGRSYQALLDAADEWIRSEEYLTGGAEMEGSYTSSDFWKHYEIVTGKTVPEDLKRNFFSCSC